MSTLYIYQGKEYSSERAVREAIGKATRMAFSAPPEKDAAAFWQRFGVTLKEAAMQPAVTTADWQERLAKMHAKSKRSQAVSAIVVTVDGMKFQGDEESQNRMTRAVVAAFATGKALSEVRLSWRLADNTQKDVTALQLAQALQLARAQQDALWPLMEA